MIMGGGVHGGDFFGTFPTLALGGPDDATNEGRWIPTTSLDQYAASLSSWFGVPTAISGHFPESGKLYVSTLEHGGVMRELEPL